MIHYTYTRTPRAYVTGGSAQRIAAHFGLRLDFDVIEHPPENIDAPDRIPTGCCTRVHGVWFLQLAPREAA